MNKVYSFYFLRGLQIEVLETDFHKMGEKLDELINSPNLKPKEGHKNSFRKAIEHNYDKIEKLLENGWSRREICDYLRESLDMKFAYSTFCGYIDDAKRFSNGKINKNS